MIVLWVPFPNLLHDSGTTDSSTPLSLLWAAVSIILSRFLLMVQAVKKETSSKEEGTEYDYDYPEPATPVTSTSFLRDKRVNWSRRSDLIELTSATP